MSHKQKNIKPWGEKEKEKIMTTVKNITELRENLEKNWKDQNLRVDHGTPSEVVAQFNCRDYIPVDQAIYARIESGKYAGKIAYIPHQIGWSNHSDGIMSEIYICEG